MDEYDARVTPREIDEREFESLGNLKEKTGFLLRYAVLAPSGHNTQPWKFSIAGDRVLVYADRSRRLPVANPDDRELVMSVAAAMMNMRVAAARFGLACDVSYLPQPGGDDLLAEVTISEDGDPDTELMELFDAIKARWTDRFPYDGRRLSAEDLALLEPYTEFGGASALFITEAPKMDRIADIVSRGGLARMSDKAFTRELSEWIRPNSTLKADGMLASSLGIPQLVSAIAPWVVRTFNSSKSQAKKDSQLVRESGAVVVLHGADDTRSVLEAGELLERLLLKLTRHDMRYSFFNLPVEIDELRAQIKDLLGLDDEPQLMLRVGYGTAARIASLRRPLNEVLTG